MNLTGWEQLLFVCAVTALLAPPLARYLAATFYLPGSDPPRTRAARCLCQVSAMPLGTGSSSRLSGWSTEYFTWIPTRP